MTTDPSQPAPSQPDRSAAPPGTIDLPLPSNAGSASPFTSVGGPSDPPVGAGPGRSEESLSYGAQPPPRLTGHRRQRVVTAGIIATTILSLLAISLLYYRWATKPEPEAMIVVWAGNDSSWDRAVVTVRGGSLRAPLTYTLRSEDNLIVRFHVPPGDYLIRVDDKAGKTLAQRRSPPERPLRSGMIWWPFRAPPAATQMGLQ